MEGLLPLLPSSLNHRLWELYLDLQYHKEFYRGMN